MKEDTAFAWRGLESLAGLSIGFVRGWSYGKVWEKTAGIKKESTDSIIQGFEMLGNGRLMGLAGYKRPYDHVLKTAALAGKYKMIGRFDTINEYLMGKKDNDKSLLMLDAFDQGKEQIRNTAVLAVIEQKWQ